MRDVIKMELWFDSYFCFKARQSIVSTHENDFGIEIAIRLNIVRLLFLNFEYCRVKKQTKMQVKKTIQFEIFFLLQIEKLQLYVEHYSLIFEWVWCFFYYMIIVLVKDSECSRSDNFS